MEMMHWNGDRNDQVHVACIGGHRPYACNEHGHDGFWELVYVRHGVLFHAINGIEYRQEAGSISIIRECDRHALAGERVAYVNVSFDVEIADALRMLPRSDESHLHRIDHSASLVGLLPRPERSAFDERCKQLAAHSRQPDALILLVGVVTTALQHIWARPDPSLPAWLSTLLPLLEGQDPVPDLPALIDCAGVSHEHLARAMRRHCGLTPRRFLDRCRVNRAAYHLATTDAAISDIAIACGFADLARMSRVFSRERGLSPRAWRRQERQHLMG
ncbi:MAG: helix-turn-helix transcriptional regulator [Planctomycetota bacterium]|nr:helix-turn-helix transcriptional regulator [Planctomycetota bacterium]